MAPGLYVCTIQNVEINVKSEKYCVMPQNSKQACKSFIVFFQHPSLRHLAFSFTPYLYQQKTLSNRPVDKAHIITISSPEQLAENRQTNGLIETINLPSREICFTFSLFNNVNCKKAISLRDEVQSFGKIFNSIKIGVPPPPSFYLDSDFHHL